MKRLIIIVLILANTLIMGCANKFPVDVRKSVQPGMSKSELINALGNPDGFQIEENKEILFYSDRFVSDVGLNKADYFFIFQNGELIQSGHGEVRQPRRSNTHTILFWHVYRYSNHFLSLLDVYSSLYSCKQLCN